MFDERGVLGPGFRVCSATTHPPASLFAQTAGKPTAQFCARGTALLCQMPGGACFLPPPSLLIISSSLAFIERWNLCFYWEMVRILLRREQAANTPVIRGKEEERPPRPTWEAGASELCSAPLERGRLAPALLTSRSVWAECILTGQGAGQCPASACPGALEDEAPWARSCRGPPWNWLWNNRPGGARACPAGRSWPAPYFEETG